MGVKIREVLPTKDFSLYLYGIIFFRSEDLFCWRAKLVFNSIRINFLWNRKNFYYQRVKTWHFNFWNASFIRLTTKGKNSTIKKLKVDRNFCFKCASNHAAVTGRESVSFFFISSLLSLQWLVLSLKCLIVPFFLFPKPTNFPTFTFFFKTLLVRFLCPSILFHDLCAFIFTFSPCLLKCEWCYEMDSILLVFFSCRWLVPAE